LNIKAKNAPFDPRKNYGRGGEMSLYFGVVVHMTEPLVNIWWADTAPLARGKGKERIK